MPRPLRVQAPDALYHITGNATDRWRLFVDDVDRTDFLALFAEVLQKYEWTCLSFALMGSHDHLMFRTNHPNLAAGMQELNSRYAVAFNRRHVRPWPWSSYPGLVGIGKRWPLVAGTRCSACSATTGRSQRPG